MANVHAIALEDLLKRKGLTISKGPHGWKISNGAGRTVDYRPESGTVHLPGSSLKFGRHVLRGSPSTMADILEGLVK